MMNKHNRAFSLVEAILATTILSIAVTGILTTFSGALVAAKIAEDYSKASTMMNELRGHVRANLLTPLEVNEGTFSLHEGFSWTVSYMETEFGNLYQVQLEVLWQRGDRTYRLNHSTYHYFDVTQDTLEIEP
jgi:type II secretory pathway pseudopilin PulG